jgi:hypothetical protein
MGDPAIAFLASQRLHIWKDGKMRPLESQFAQAIRERAASMERRHGWKTQGRGARFQNPWGGGSPEQQPEVMILLTGLTAGSDSEILYSMETDAVSGVFRIDGSGVETRLFHTADFRIRQIAANAAGTELAGTAIRARNAGSNIVVFTRDGQDLLEVTEGDSIDFAPRWIPGPGRRIIFQSAGVGRGAGGSFAGIGACTIHRLDLDSGELEEVVAEAGRDLMQPRETEDGTIYYIRKPHISAVAETTLWGSLKDAFLFPFRLAGAIFSYFNIFSMMYSGKPLITRKGAVQKQLDPRQLFIQQNLSQANTDVEEAELGIAPGSWELVRRRPNGATDVVASKVLAFDITGDGSILCSDGAEIRRIGADGQMQNVLQASMIQQLVAL